MIQYNTDYASDKSEENEMLLYNARTENTVILNSIATILYECCKESNKADIINKYLHILHEQFIDLDNDENLKSDAEQMLAGFLNQGIILN